MARTAKKILDKRERRYYHIICNNENEKSNGGSMSYACELCGYVYKTAEGDPENGIPEGTEFEELPEDWTCPLCGAGKEDFESVEDDE